MTLPAKILIALVCGVLLGVVARVSGSDALLRALALLDPLGVLFIRLVTMVVVPLVVSSLFVGVASLGDLRRLGRIGGRTFAYFAATTLLAATIGVVVAEVARVGRGLDPAARDAITSRFSAQGAGAVQAAAGAPSLVQTLIDMTPQNPFASAAQADLLPLVIAVCIFAAAATTIPHERRVVVVQFFEGIRDLSMVVIGWMMTLAPTAVLVLIAGMVARSGADLLRSLIVYACAVVAALAIHVAIVLLPMLRIGARMGVRPFFGAVADALLLAFSTASSSATLPVSMAAARRIGVSTAVVSFVLPAGTTLNKNGAAVYKAVTAVFIAQLYGLPLGLSQLVTVVVASSLAAAAGAGVPGSSLVTTLIVLNAIGLGPYAAAGIALVVGIDRPLDMCRTAVNTIGNLVGAVVVARGEGERVGRAHGGEPALE